MKQNKMDATMKKLDVNTAIQYFEAHPNEFKTILHEVQTSTTSVGSKILKAIGNCFSESVSEDEACDAFWGMAYAWADRRYPVTGSRA